MNATPAPSVAVRCPNCSRLLALVSPGAVVRITCRRCKAVTLKQAVASAVDTPRPPVVR